MDEMKIEETEFSYEGYQVVRGEFFAHTKEPSITFNCCKIYVNMACIKKLPDVEFVHILVNPHEKKLVIRPCKEEEKDSFSWRSQSAKVRPKQITCRIFFAKIIELMNWDPDYRYKLIGKLIRSGSEFLFIFDLKTAEVFRRMTGVSKQTSSRIPTFPKEWQNQFGLTFDEHKKSLQINIVDGYAVFGLKRKNNDNFQNKMNAQISIKENLQNDKSKTNHFN